MRPARWAALGIGFLGVLLVAQPGPNTLQTGSLFALGNAILFGTVTAGVRGMTSTESTETLTMYQMVLLTSVFTLLLPFGVVTPSFGDGVIMVLNGVANAIGQYWWTRALHLAPTSAVAPFQYLSLVWALVLGFVRLGRPADDPPADRLGHRGGVGIVSAVARVDAAAGDRRNSGGAEVVRQWKFARGTV